MDAFGKLVLQEDKKDFIGEYTKLIDLVGFSRGIYMVQIKTKDTSIRKKIVLQ